MDNLIKVRFKDGRVKEVSARIAFNESYQKSHSFTPLVDAPIAPIPEKKKELKNPVAEINNDKDIAAQVETETLIQEVTEKVQKKRGRKPKQK